MTVQAIRFTGSRKSDFPESNHLACETTADIENLKEILPAVYLIRDDQLFYFLGFTSLVANCGKKHKDVGLIKSFKGLKGICAIRGSHRNAGQLKRSCWKLLENAQNTQNTQNTQKENVFIVGVSTDLFTELWDETNREKEKRSPDLNPAKIQDGTLFRQPDLYELLVKEPVPPDLITTYVGNAVQIRLVRQLIVRASRQDDHMLILGESGTGKELVARAIHQYNASRENTPFVPVNCGAIPEDLLESELFGFEKGAHSTAFTDKKGLWEMAENGTLFLDEIGDLSLDHQVKINRALQDGVIHPVGSEDVNVPVSAHVIAATNRDIFLMMKQNRFRDDLYYRLRSFIIFTPALREHRDDIPLLANSFWEEMTKGDKSRLPTAIVEEMKNYPWYGNGRELKMFLRNMHILFGRDNLSVDHLRAVSRYEKFGLTFKNAQVSETDVQIHYAECLQHLSRASEVLRAIEVTLRPLLSRKLRTTADRNNILNRMHNHIYELEAICLHPLLFHSETMFDAVDAFNKKLYEFHTRMEKNPFEISSYWKKQMAGVYKTTQRMIFHEVARLVNMQRKM